MKGPSSAPTSEIKYPQEAQPYVRRAYEVLAGLVGSYQPPIYPGPYGTPPAPEQLGGVSGTLGPLMLAQQMGTTPISLQELLATSTGAYLPATNPYIQQIETGLTQLYQQDLERQLADLQARYARFGQAASSPLARAESELMARSQANLLQQLGQLRLGAYESERARQVGAVSQALGIEPSIASQLFQMGTQLWGQADTETLRRLQEWVRAAQERWQPFAYLGGVPSAMPPAPQYGPPPIVPIMGGLFSLLTAPSSSILGRVIFGAG